MLLQIRIKRYLSVLVWFLVACSKLPDKPKASEFDNICDPKVGPPVPPFPFYIYKDFGSSENHYFLDDVSANRNTISINQGSTTSPYSGTTCLEITWPTVNINNDTVTHWYWLTSDNNLGGKNEGYNLSKAKRLVFAARGKLGGEKVAFLVGGLVLPNQPYPDTVTPATPVPFGTFPLELKQSWEEYEIETKLLIPSLCRVIGAFSFNIEKKRNPTTVTFYIDEIRYE